MFVHDIRMFMMVKYSPVNIQGKPHHLSIIFVRKRCVFDIYCSLTLDPRVTNTWMLILFVPISFQSPSETICRQETPHVNQAAGVAFDRCGHQVRSPGRYYQIMIHTLHTLYCIAWHGIALHCIACTTLHCTNFGFLFAGTPSTSAVAMPEMLPVATGICSGPEHCALRKQKSWLHIECENLLVDLFTFKLLTVARAYRRDLYISYIYTHIIIWDNRNMRRV